MKRSPCQKLFHEFRRLSRILQSLPQLTDAVLTPIFYVNEDTRIPQPLYDVSSPDELTMAFY